MRGKDFVDIVDDPNGNTAAMSQLNRIVPGDVFYWYYDIGDFTSHIAIVDRVDVNPDTGNVQDITLIESTFGYYVDEGGYPGTQMVRKGLSLRNLSLVSKINRSF